MRCMVAAARLLIWQAGTVSTSPVARRSPAAGVRRPHDHDLADLGFFMA
jgi:hypothetical protein